MTAEERAKDVSCPHTYPFCCLLCLTEAIKDAEQAMKERCAAKIEEQKQLLTGLFREDGNHRRHEPLCNDLAKAIRNLE